MLILDSVLFSYLILPALIFVARIGDQSLGILRLIMAAKGYRRVVFILGFVESLIWLTAISQIMKHLDNAFCYLAFSGGFAAGNYIGVYIEEKISMGMVVIRVIPQKNSDALISVLRAQGFGVTAINAEGMNGEVRMFFTVIRRKHSKKAIEIIQQHNPQAFFTIEEVRSVSEGFFQKRKPDGIFSSINPFRRKENR